MDVRVGLWRKLSPEELMLLNCGVGEDSWESLGLQGDPTSPFWRSALGVLWKEWCWSWNFSTLTTSCEELTHWKRLWCWEVLGAGGEVDDRGWDGWMASLTQWTWIWVNSGSWWWTGRPDVVRFMGSQRVAHDWVTELNWYWSYIVCLPVCYLSSLRQCKSHELRGLPSRFQCDMPRSQKMDICWTNKCVPDCRTMNESLQVWLKHVLCASCWPCGTKIMSDSPGYSFDPHMTDFHTGSNCIKEQVLNSLQHPDTLSMDHHQNVKLRSSFYFLEICPFLLYAAWYMRRWI